MRYYRYSPDPANFCSFQVPYPNAEHVVGLFFRSLSVIDQWQPLEMENIAATNIPVGDFPSFSNFSRMPLCSERGWNVLQPFLKETTEALLVYGNRGECLFLLNVIPQIDALDLQKAEFSVNVASGRINKVTKYAFREELLVGIHMFKTPLESGAELFLSEEVRFAIEREKLAGLRWKEL